jgi:chorismate dehydratase
VHVIPYARANRDYLISFPTFAAKFKLIALDRKIRVGAVSYLNTKPLLYGIEHSPVIEEISLTTEYPSLIADKLLNDEIDIGLVPVSIIPLMPEYHINTRFCIGCDGPVASVCLFSDVPVEQIRKVLLDYQSRTSVALAGILFERHWKHKSEWQHAGPDFLEQIKGDTAAVVIGDRALEQKSISAYSYDLGEAWKEMTGLPFVFAAWISNKSLDRGWVQRFDEANAFGIKNISRAIESLPPMDLDLNEYFTRYLSYELDERKQKGLRYFLELLSDQNQGALSQNISAERTGFN